ncbi:MAG: hypothetical protein LBS68_01010 [Puniceicoccales bacterium]|jgi:hypothetical protein|nr:hypothetical protein [Puniceicoccales bacterium]
MIDGLTGGSVGDALSAAWEKIKEAGVGILTFVRTHPVLVAGIIGGIIALATGGVGAAIVAVAVIALLGVLLRGTAEPFADGVIMNKEGEGRWSSCKKLMSIIGGNIKAAYENMNRSYDALTNKSQTPSS